LDVILKSHGLGYITEKGVVRIVKLSEIEVAGEELSTEVVIINYAKALDLVNQIKNVLSPKGTVSVDPRTNSFIIRDIKGGVDEAKRLLGKLDSETPQVVIEARIVEATTDFSRDLGVQWGAGYTADASHGNPTGYYFPNSYNVVAGGGGAFALNPPSAGGVGAGASGGAVAGISFGSIGNTLNLDLRLSAMEKQGWGKVMSSPKITTIDNKEALIQQGISIPYLSTSSAGTETKFIDANLSLTVTPHVTSDGKLLMKIRASKNAPSLVYSSDAGIAIDKKEASTEVLVRDGDTTVIGGIYQITKGEVTSSVPFLGKIPVIGWLFKSKSMEDKKTELLIFITPRIIKSQS
ncbi:MAG: type IV pilus secretin PilQ, partial [Deltaproteobacteria bacterium]